MRWGTYASIFLLFCVVLFVPSWGTITHFFEMGAGLGKGEADKVSKASKAHKLQRVRNLFKVIFYPSLLPRARFP